ncbi:OpgC family protein [Oceaniglobus indicus]|uniref:OpgC family protein n=1 Tax=Oceaniglobus indicus TaxID=2047749 RepID=UPI000C17853C|nr:OpgC domain-containing protein [Oceaniglobus indicus]
MSLSNVVDVGFHGRPANRAAPDLSPGRPSRDPRLDFYRGCAMIIILISHTPGNFWSNYIPARFGFSDATEIFVFCSGMASAIAFGGTFVRRGWWLGTARVAFRLWQIYWAHIAMFVALAAMLATIDAVGGFDKTYIGSLNLWKFFADPAPQLIGLMTLTYVPNYFDILPMYMVVLAMMPVVVLLSQGGIWLVALASGAVWLLAQEALWTWLGMADVALAFPAEPWSERRWFFNPFGWQLVFFTGFAFMRGWIPAPPVNAALIVMAAVIVLAIVPLSSFGSGRLGLEFAREFRTTQAGWIDKSDFAILRYVHFLALAYLAWVVAGRHGDRLRPEGQGAGARVWRRVVAVIMRIGQQSLAVFLFSMVFARFSGFVVDQVGRNGWSVSIANIIGIALLVAVAYSVGWFKGQPWKTSGTG